MFALILTGGDMPMKINRLQAVACLAVVMTLLAFSVNAATYSVTELLPPFGDVSTFALGLNARGDVVGESGRGSQGSAVVWKNGIPQVLAVLSGSSGGEA